VLQGASSFIHEPAGGALPVDTHLGHRIDGKAAVDRRSGTHRRYECDGLGDTLQRKRSHPATAAVAERFRLPAADSSASDDGGPPLAYSNGRYWLPGGIRWDVNSQALHRPDGSQIPDLSDLNGGGL
jgi:hypothetical protein